MNTKLQKILAVVCGAMLAVGIMFCFLTKESELIGTVVIFGILYVVYLLALSKKLKKDGETDRKKSPLKRR